MKNPAQTPVFWLLATTFLFLAHSESFAGGVKFEPREIFRIPFGKEKEMLGARIEKGQLLIPSSFSMGYGGFVYINDLNNYRVVKYSIQGAYQMSIQYPPTARQVFAYPDAAQNLWLLISDPARGFYYGIYDKRGKRLREGVFSQFQNFRLYVDDQSVLHLILSPDKNPKDTQMYVLDQQTFLVKKENVAKPPEAHHRIEKGEQTYYVDVVPGSGKDEYRTVNQVRDDSKKTVNQIKGKVVYVTDEKEIYTKVGDCDFHVYDPSGVLKGKVSMTGYGPMCAAVRFDPVGNIYQLDGIPNASGGYDGEIPGLRLVLWERM